jgi:hypothetical protein
MPWIVLVALFLLLLKGFQWLQHWQLPWPVLVVGGMSLAVLSNLTLSVPALSNFKAALLTQAVQPTAASGQTEQPLADTSKIL